MDRLTVPHLEAMIQSDLIGLQPLLREEDDEPNILKKPSIGRSIVRMNQHERSLLVRDQRHSIYRCNNKGFDNHFTLLCEMDLWFGAKWWVETVK
jgi:hypothetical protein